MFDYDDDEQAELRRREKPSLDVILDALATGGEKLLSANIFYGLSGLSPEEIDRLRPIWRGLKDERRRTLSRHIADLSESDFELDYGEFGVLVLDDDDPEVRKAAIDMLWIDNSVTLLSRLIKMAQTDQSNDVRAAAMAELGRFILLGEYEELPEREAQRAQQVAIKAWNDKAEDFHVRRRALEALANSSHDSVPNAILEAYNHPELLMKASAVFAMGRTCNTRWTDLVMTELGSSEPEIQFEAARAAGELGLSQAVRYLAALASGDDAETREVAVWSLGEIGGDKAVNRLSALAEEAEEREDDDFLELIEDALANAEMFGNLDLEFDDSDDDD
ncbi:MAG: HEAT repeat domain-containing protein [Anaerolineaceae bacterium]|nr:HEAT repeat domain-containing protein [Anaerolineaceae bacterium]